MTPRKEMSVFNSIRCGVVVKGTRLRAGGTSPGRETIKKKKERKEGNENGAVKMGLGLGQQGARP